MKKQNAVYRIRIRFYNCRFALREILTELLLRFMTAQVLHQRQATNINNLIRSLGEQRYSEFQSTVRQC